jgi:hypothetical protein
VPNIEPKNLDGKGRNVEGWDRGNVDLHTGEPVALKDLPGFGRERIALAWAWMQENRRDLPW